MVLAAAEAALDEEEYADLALQGAQVGGVLIRQRFSRGDELEADYHGIRYMVAAGYNPLGAVTLQEKLVALNERGAPGLMARLFASHPPSPERVANNRAAVGALGGPVGEIGRQRYQAAIAYAKSKQPAYGRAEEARSLGQRGASARAIAQIDQAIAIEPNEARFHGLKGDLLRTVGQHQRALAQYGRALRLDDGYHGYYLGSGLASARLGRHADAVRYLQESNRLFVTTTANQVLAALLR